MSSLFDLDRFRDLAFGRADLPDHPLKTVEDARKMLAGLPAEDAAASLAELTNWARSMNETASFSAARRARIFMLLDDAARPCWRVLGRAYLARDGKPMERRDGDKSILRAFFDSASEFANGFAIVLDEEPPDWVRDNHALLHVRVMRWLGRRLALSHMLKLSAVGAIWERLHFRNRGAEELGLARSVVPAFAGNRLPSSPRQEYVRALLLEMAAPDALRGRDVELVYRICGRIAPTIQLEAERSDATAFAVVPNGDARPAAIASVPPTGAAPLYIGTANCLIKLRAMLERDMDRDPREPDTLFGGDFTLRERFDTVKRLLDHWGMDPPRRRTKRVGLASPARIVCGFDNVVEVLPAWDGRAAQGQGKKMDLQLAIDDTTRTLKRAQLRAATRTGPARVVDASTGGLGIAIRPGDAPWAALGALVALVIEPGKDWLVGVIRRIYAVDQELRLGVQVLTVRPRVMIFSVDTINADNAWEEATMFEATYKERFKKSVLLEPLGAPLGAADFLLAPGSASRNTQFEVPLGSGKQRIWVTQVRSGNEYFQHAAFEPLGVVLRAGMMP